MRRIPLAALMIAALAACQPRAEEPVVETPPEVTVPTTEPVIEGDAPILIDSTPDSTVVADSAPLPQ